MTLPRGHRNDEGTSLIMAMMFTTGVGLVVMALLTYSFTALNSGQATALSAQRAADVAGALQTATNDVRNSVYTNDGTTTPCLSTDNQRTYTALAAGAATTVTCSPVTTSGLGGGTSVAITSANRPPLAILTLGTYAGGAAAGVVPADPAAVSVLPSVNRQGTPVVISGSNIAGATAVQIGTVTELQTAKGTTMSPCPGGLAAAGCFTMDGSAVSISVMPDHANGAVLIKVITLGTAANGSFTYATAPAVPTATAAPGPRQATVTWTAPYDGGSTITGYVVTTIKSGSPPSPTTVPSTPTSTTVPNLTTGSSYTFTVAAVNAVGTGPATATNSVTPTAATPAPPTIGAPSAGTLGATVQWTAPVDNGGSAITGYVVTPYRDGKDPQTSQTFGSTLTTQKITGLVDGASYTFRVSAKNAVGTGTASAASSAVTANPQLLLTYASPLAQGKLRINYSQQLARSGGTPAYTWTISAGALPAGLMMSTSGLISGAPTVTGTFTFTVLLTDGFGATATKSTVLTVTPTRVPGPPETSDSSAGSTHRSAAEPQGAYAIWRERR